MQACQPRSLGQSRYWLDRRAGHRHAARRVARAPARRHRGFARSTLHWHDLRHEYASRLVERGVPLAQVRDLLGHASILTTERYDNQRLEALQAAAARLEAGKAFDAVRQGVADSSGLSIVPEIEKAQVSFKFPPKRPLPKAAAPPRTPSEVTEGM